MSLVKATAFNDTSESGNAVLYGVAAAQGGMNFRNRIINGDMRIDQRNAGASSTINGTFAYTVDRWLADDNTDGVFTVQRSTTAPTDFVNSIIITTTTADSSLSAGQYSYVAQVIEGFNTADLLWGTANAKTITLSFWVRSSLTGTFGGSLRNGAGNRSYPFTYTINSANTFEYKTVTIAGDTTGTWATDNSAGITVFFGLGVGSTFSGTAGAWAGSNFLSATGGTSVIGTLNATWYITGVQLEVGSVATPFERRPYGTELALCQRYYEVFGGVINNFPLITQYGLSGVSLDLPLKFAVEKRAAPTVTITGTWAKSNIADFLTRFNGTQGVGVQIVPTSNGMAQVYPDSTDDKITASSEL